MICRLVGKCPIICLISILGPGAQDAIRLYRRNQRVTICPLLLSTTFSKTCLKGLMKLMCVCVGGGVNVSQKHVAWNQTLLLKPTLLLA